MYENQCYLVPKEKCGNRAQRLRLVPTKSGQIKGITFAKDYLLKDIISKFLLPKKKIILRNIFLINSFLINCK